MKLTVRQLRRVIREAKPKKIGASPEYMKKEAIRSSLERMVIRAAANMKSEAELKDLFKTFDMALNALKMVPLEAWKKEAENLLMGGATDI